MTLAELVDTKKEIFERPSTKKAILDGKKVIEVHNFQDIVPALEHRRRNEVGLYRLFNVSYRF